MDSQAADLIVTLDTFTATTSSYGTLYKNLQPKSGAKIKVSRELQLLVEHCLKSEMYSAIMLVVHGLKQDNTYVASFAHSPIIVLTLGSHCERGHVSNVHMWLCHQHPATQHVLHLSMHALPCHCSHDCDCQASKAHRKLAFHFCR